MPERLPLRPLYGPILYYLVLGFALTVTWLIGEKTLLLAGLFIYTPLTTLLAVTIAARWQEGQKSARRNLKPWESVSHTGDAPSNGRGSRSEEVVWQDRDLEEAAIGTEAAEVEHQHTDGSTKRTTDE